MYKAGALCAYYRDFVEVFKRLDPRSHTPRGGSTSRPLHLPFGAGLVSPVKKPWDLMRAVAGIESLPASIRLRRRSSNT